MARVSTSLDAVLAAIRGKLVADAVFKKAETFCSLDPDAVAEKAPPSDRFAGVTFAEVNQVPGTVTTDASTDDVPDCEGEFVVACYFTVNVDSLGRDDAVLTTADAGVMAVLKRAIKSLNNQELADRDGNDLLLCSLTFLGLRARGRQGKSGRHRFDLRFAAAFDWDLTE